MGERMQSAWHSVRVHLCSWEPEAGASGRRRDRGTLHGLGWAGCSQKGQPVPTPLSQLAHPAGVPRWGGGKAGDAVSAFTQVRVQSGTTRLDRALQADRCCDGDSTGARGLREQWAASHPARFGATWGKSSQPAG